MCIKAPFSQNTIEYMKKENTIVLKYGGTSIANPKLLQKAAHNVKEYYDNNNQIVVVVSAMGKTTDALSKTSQRNYKRAF